MIIKLKKDLLILAALWYASTYQLTRICSPYIRTYGVDRIWSYSNIYFISFLHYVGSYAT
jgi:hypothetical protein